MPKKGGKAAAVDQIKEWRDDRVFEERDGEHEEYVDILSESFNYVYNDLDGSVKDFLRKFRTCMMNAKIQLITLVEPEKLSKTQAILDNVYDTVTPFVVDMTNQTQFHLASTKADVVRYRQYVHVQSKVRGRRLFDAFKCWSAQILRDREQTAELYGSGPVKMFRDRLARKLLKNVWAKWYAVFMQGEYVAKPLKSPVFNQWQDSAEANMESRPLHGREGRRG